MAADTPISWADDTSSPWWGCTKVSPACTHCYAEGMSSRFKRGSWGPKGERALRVEACLSDLARFARRGLREGRPRRVFLGSMCDVFEQRRDLIIPRIHLWDGLAELSRGPLADGIRVLVPTKRAREMAEYAEHHGWPRICWAGVTVEDQKRADERIPYLLRVPARVRFVSAEPLLGRILLDNGESSWLTCDGRDISGTGDHYCCASYDNVGAHFHGIDLVIGGGESGRNARPCHPDWARSLRDQCSAANVAFHWKQNGCWVDVGDAHDLAESGYHRADNERVVNLAGGHGFHGENPRVMRRVGKRAAGRLLDGREHNDVPEVPRD